MTNLAEEVTTAVLGVLKRGGDNYNIYVAVKAALAATPAVGGEDWQDDPSADERWNAGCDFAMLALCGFMGVDPQMVSWDAATETVDGDVRAVIGNILRAKMGEDWSPLAAPPASPLRGRESLIKRAAEFIRTNDPFGDYFSEHDLHLLDSEMTRLDGERE